MPNIASNKKSLLKDKKKRLFRISYKKKYKSVLKAFVEAKDISPVYKSLDMQLSKGLITKNRCNKLKSRHMIALNSLGKK